MHPGITTRMKKFIEYLKNSHIIEICLVIFWCSTIYIIREKIEFKPQTVSFINLLTLSVLAMILYYAVRAQHIRWYSIVCILSLLFIFNYLYDENVFKRVFHFELEIFWMILGIVVTFVIIFPIFKKIIQKLFCIFDTWKKNKVTEGKQDFLDKKQQNQDRIYHDENRNITVNSNAEKSHMFENPDVFVQQKEVRQEKSNKENDKIENENSSQKHEHMYTVLIIIYFALFIIIMVICLFSKRTMNILKDINTSNLPTLILSIAILIMFLVFIAGITISLIIKWIQIIDQVIKKQHKGEMYFVYACALFLGSQYIFSNYTYSTDDFADLLLDGKLFTFPLILSVLIPVFLIFAENIISFTRKNQSIEEVLKECAKKTIKIAQSIVESLLIFIEFVTSDYLTSIIELTKESDSDENINSDEDIN